MYAFNLSKDQVESRIVRPWNEGKPIVVRGRQYNAGKWMASIYEYQGPFALKGDADKWLLVERWGEDVTDNFITKPFGDEAVSAVDPSAVSGQPSPSQKGPEPPRDAVDPRTVMVVHGRDLAIRDAMFNLLRALVSLANEGSPYVGRVLERAFEVAQAAVVLFTPDEEVRLAERLREEKESDELELQARPNVFFEAGLAFGRFPEKTILIEFGDVRAASDLAGRHVLRFDGGAERRHELAERLAVAGCPVDRSGTDWLRIGDFASG
jgi:predicted nucleotide-binding protein